MIDKKHPKWGEEPQKRKRGQLLSFVILLFSFPLSTSITYANQIIGNTTKWSPLTLELIGPSAREVDTSPNPFLDYRLTVTFTAPSGREYHVPGFFAGDGQGFGQGNRWQARFAASETGLWQYHAQLDTGTNIAVNTDLSVGNAAYLESASGQFNIEPQSIDAPEFLRYGRLEYQETHYLKFSDGPYWIKGGVDSPENFLGFDGFDGTVDKGGSQFLHSFQAHRQDALDSDPQFSNSSTGKDGQGITGALNYLSSQGINSIYFLPMNLGGDGQETYPFIGGNNTSFDKTHFDISKLYQWNQVLQHAQNKGIALNIQLSETEPANEKWLDNGKLGIERKLFFRELVARFAYLLAGKWNLGEENDFPVSELQAHASYIRSIDWSNKPIAVHTQINNFRDYDELVGDNNFSASSIQYDPEFAGQFVEQWREQSSQAGRPWVIDMDENTGGISANNANTRRKQILYDVYFSGGNLEWYFGYHPLPLGGDLTAEDFRLREDMWRMMRYAREFMQNELPFWRMQPADHLVTGEKNDFGGAEVFAATDEVYAVYLPNAAISATLDLSAASGSFSQQWFNPVSGQFEGEEKTITAGSSVYLGAPPSRTNDDWVVLVRSHNAPDITQEYPNEIEESIEQVSVTPLEEEDTIEVNAPESTPETTAPNTSSNAAPIFFYNEIATAIAGETLKWNVAFSDPDGVAPILTADTLPHGMQLTVIEDGLAHIEWRVPVDITDSSVDIELIAIDVDDANLHVVEHISFPVQHAQAQTDNNISEDQQPDSPTLNNNTIGPQILPIRDQQVSIGTTLKLLVIPFDPEGYVPALSAESLPGGATFEDNLDGTRTFIWTPNKQQIGTHVLRFIANGSDLSPYTVQEQAIIEVVSNLSNTTATTTSSNVPPSFVSQQAATVNAGNRIEVVIHAIDPDGVVPHLNVINPPEGATFNDNGNGSRTFSWVAQAQQSGELEVEFLATDAFDPSVQTTHTLLLLIYQP